MIHTTKQSVLHLADRPFATALAMLLLSSGIITIAGLGLTHDALDELVPEAFVNGLAVTYAIAGLLLMAGMAFGRADIEASGCVLGFSGVLIRLIALIVAFGFTAAVLSSVILYISILWAFAERFRQILNHQNIVRVTGRIEVGEDDARRLD